ncbi:non-specific lipid transfer protein GPI-anchored 14-like isoform X2 [Mercurialis annua]|uniref:non-specific lipid transfer protein GPI-anchored 14-like isoform X2 n=1 Tax=Mercurialis annua TaxID=3986 RepID=UPI00215F36A9|nr:non-specific lipid transfer protein GPI-anchored 14-like isoform X2 [Mercurialis annua]
MGSKIGAALLILSMVFMSGAGAGDDKDKDECAAQLVGLATCLPYVGGNAKTPTPDCCNGLNQLLKTNKKCLCVVIKDRDDPDLGLQINLTLALALPSVCHATANVSQCPALLHLDPTSPEAQVFYPHANNQSASSLAPSPGPNGEGNPTSGNSEEHSAQPPSSGCNNGKGWILFFIFIFPLFMFSNYQCIT